MNPFNRKTDSTQNPAAAAFFFLISFILSPVSLLGYVVFVGCLFLAGRTPGVSTTAQDPLSARWFQHYLGVRKDEAAYRLLTALPEFSPLGWYLVAGPTLLAHRLTGYAPKAFRYPYEGDVPVQYQASARQTFFDNAVERNLGEITQFVLLGAHARGAANPGAGNGREAGLERLRHCGREISRVVEGSARPVVAQLNRSWRLRPSRLRLFSYPLPLFVPVDRGICRPIITNVRGCDPSNVF